MYINRWFSALLPTQLSWIAVHCICRFSLAGFVGPESNLIPSPQFIKDALTGRGPFILSTLLVFSSPFSHSYTNLNFMSNLSPQFIKDALTGRYFAHIHGFQDFAQHHIYISDYISLRIFQTFPYQSISWILKSNQSLIKTHICDLRRGKNDK